MSDETFELKKEQVYGRDESPSRLFGWTFGELGLMAGVLLLVNILFHRALITLGGGAATYLYLRKVKSMLPERFLSNATKFYLRRDFLYRAGSPDTEWRPPIVPTK